MIISRGGKDIIRGLGGKDRICGGPGRDSIYGGTGPDLISGFLAADRIYGDSGNDFLAGGASWDELFGESGNDALSGGAGRFDRLYGGDGNDSLRGGEGDYDWLHPGAGDDSSFGGPGQGDTAAFINADGPMVVSLQARTATGSGTDSLTGLENILGSPFNDTLTGDRGPNAIIGGDNKPSAGCGHHSRFRRRRLHSSWGRQRRAGWGTRQ